MSEFLSLMIFDYSYDKTSKIHDVNKSRITSNNFKLNMPREREKSHLVKRTINLFKLPL